MLKRLEFARFDELPVGGVYEVIQDFDLGPLRNTNKPRKLLVIEAAETFGDVPGTGCGRISKLISKLEVSRRPRPSADLVERAVSVCEQAARRPTRGCLEHQPCRPVLQVRFPGRNRGLSGLFNVSRTDVAVSAIRPFETHSRNCLSVIPQSHSGTLGTPGTPPLAPWPFGTLALWFLPSSVERVEEQAERGVCLGAMLRAEAQTARRGPAPTALRPSRPCRQ